MFFDIFYRGNEWNGNTLDEKNKNDSTTLWEKYVDPCLLTLFIDISFVN